MEKFLVKTLTNEKRFLNKVKIVYAKPELSEHVGARMGKATNYVLNNIDLREYDFY